LTTDPTTQRDASVYESRYKALVESHADLISRFSPEGQLIYVSQSYCDHCGKSANQLINHSIYDDIPVDEREQAKTRLAQLSVLTPTIRGINSIETRSGETRIVDWVNSAIFDSQHDIIEIQSVGRDITEQLTIEAELKRSNAEFSQFAHLAAHDLKAPVRNISQLAGILKEDYRDLLDNAGEEIIDLMSERLSRMEQLIEALLSYATVGNVRETEPVNLNEIIQTVLDNLESVIHESDASIHLTELPVVLGNATDCIQLLQNLISNSIKFRADATPEITISVEIVKTFCHLSIADNGIGIDFENFQKIFKPLYRLNSQNAYPGSGIGLAACKKICKRMGGGIEVESTLGKGSKFRVWLPLILDE
jgi:PAS domain S-box-containing protein